MDNQEKNNCEEVVESSVPFLDDDKSKSHRVVIIDPPLGFRSLSKGTSEDDGMDNNNISPNNPKASIRKDSIRSLGKRGWRRYLGITYTILAVNMLSLMTTFLKKYKHIHPFNAGIWVTWTAIVVNFFVVVYTVKWGDKPILENVWPLAKHKKYVGLLLVRAIISSLISYVTILAFHYVTAADVRTVVSASVIMVYIIGWMFLGETCGIIPIIVAFVALGGIGIMTRPPILTGKDEFDTQTLIGIGLAFLCMVMVSIQLALLRYLQTVHHSVSNGLAYFWAFFQGIVLSFAFGVFAVPEPSEILALGFVGILFALALAFLVLALQLEEAGVVALVRTSEVIFVFFWQWVIVGTYPDLISILGASLVITGVIVVTLRKWISSLPKDDQIRKRFAFLLY